MPNTVPRASSMFTPPPSLLEVRESRGLGWGGGTPIYFVYRDVTPVRVSFSGSSVLNRVYNFTFFCLKQGRHRKYSPFLPLQPHNIRWFRVPSLKCVKCKIMYRFLLFWIHGNAWSSFEQGKKLQHFLLDRVAKFTSLCLEQGQGFTESAELPYPNSCLVQYFLNCRVELQRSVNILNAEWLWWRRPHGIQQVWHLQTVGIYFRSPNSLIPALVRSFSKLL